jgi:hypothetical protein
MSSNLIMRYFTIPVSGVNKRSVQTSIYALTTGVDSVMVGVVGVSVALISDITLLIVMSAGLFLIDPVSAIGTSLIFGFIALFLYRAMYRKMQRLGEREHSILRAHKEFLRLLILIGNFLYEIEEVSMPSKLVA